MANEWLFDVTDPMLEGFQEDLLLLAETREAMDAVTWKLGEIQDRGAIVGNFCIVDDEVVRLAKTGANGSAQPMIIGFLLDVRLRLIRPFMVCRADAVNLENAGGPASETGSTAEPVEHVIRRALKRAGRQKSH